MSTVSDGNLAESKVAEYLSCKGYEIVEQNWRTKYAEIDIVAQKDKTIYFVEVKYRKNDYAGDGFDYITGKKLHHMQRAAELWVTENNWHGPYELMAASVIGAGEIQVRQIA